MNTTIRVKRKRTDAPPEYLVFDENAGVGLKRARLPGKVFHLIPRRSDKPALDNGIIRPKIEMELCSKDKNGLEVYEARIRRVASLIYGKGATADLSKMVDKYLQFHSDASVSRMEETEEQSAALPPADSIEDFVYDVYQVASDQFSQDNYLELLDGPGTRRIQRVLLADADATGEGEEPLLYHDGDGDVSADGGSEDSNAEDYWTHEYPDEDFAKHFDDSSEDELGSDDDDSSDNSDQDFYEYVDHSGYMPKYHYHVEDQGSSDDN